MDAEMKVSLAKTKEPEKVTGVKGGLRTMPFIISNETFEKVASFGLHANMILYLTHEYHMDAATGASILFLWSAMSNFTPIIGAFLSDSLLGRFRVISLGTIISLFGMIVLWLTARFPETRPAPCDDPFKQKCRQASTAQAMLLFSAMGLMSIGSGGIKPCSLAFGADQLDKPENPKNERRLQTFFNWYYASVGISVMLAVTVIVYVQMKYGWIIGFGVPVVLMTLSTVLFFLGSRFYIKVPANKKLSSGFLQVIAASWKNKHLALPPKEFDAWFSPKGSKFVAPTDKLRYLNKACIIRSPEDIGHDGLAKDPWSLCTVRQVEEFKAVIKVLPIWSTSIIIAVTISQHAFPVLQASTMDRHFFGKFQIPAASFSLFSILTLTIWVTIYDRIIVPVLSKYTSEPRGLSFKQRMGAGLAISCLAQAVSAEVERQRRSLAIKEGFSDKPSAIVDMSARWLIPQHCLTGLAESLNAIGQLEFYYSQFPKSMTSIAVALLYLGFGVGSLVGSFLVNILDDVTKKGDGVSWVSSNLNKGHYDYYYWVVTGLCVVNFFYFLLCSWAYGPCEDKKMWDESEEEGVKEVEDMVPPKSGEYAVIFSA